MDFRLKGDWQMSFDVGDVGSCVFISSSEDNRGSLEESQCRTLLGGNNVHLIQKRLLWALAIGH